MHALRDGGLRKSACVRERMQPGKHRTCLPRREGVNFDTEELELVYVLPPDEYRVVVAYGDGFIQGAVSPIGLTDVPYFDLPHVSDCLTDGGILSQYYSSLVVQR